MKNSMQYLKIQPSLLDKIQIENQRILAQITAMNDNSPEFTGELLKHALSVMAWHLDEQNDLLETLKGHIKRINKLIEQGDAVFQQQGGNDEQA